MAAIEEAASASNTDINTAIAAVDTGGLVIVPAGDSTWTGAVAIGKNLTLQGNGVGSTIFRYTDNMITVGQSLTDVRITGIETVNTGVAGKGHVIVESDLTGWFEVDNCKFAATNFQIGIYARGPGAGGPRPQGLVWNCEFVNTHVLQQADLLTTAHDIFSETLAYGSTKQVFVEDCTYAASVFMNFADSDYGGVSTYRYNTLTITASTGEGFISHSTRDPTAVRGARMGEMYNNSIIIDGGSGFRRGFFCRNAKNLYYNNDITVINSGTINPTAIDTDANTTARGSNSGGGGVVVDGNLPLWEDTTFFYHTGADNASVLTAGGSPGWTTDEWAGMIVFNRTKGESATITSNTASTITGTLSGSADWDIGDQFYVSQVTGAHDGSSGASVLTDSGESWTTDLYVDAWIYNITDGSKGQISGNTGTTVTATLAGGTDNDWDAGDTYKITNGYPWRDQIGTGTDAFEYVGGAWPVQSFGLDDANYAWGNTYDNGGGETALNITAVNDDNVVITENRDFFNGTEYVYTPVAYPHPLRSAAAADNNPKTGGRLAVIASIL